MAKHVMSAAALFLVILLASPVVAESTHQDAQAAYEAGDYKRAAVIWRQLADQGDDEAMFSLGALALEGRGGLPMDHGASVDWFTKSARLGNPLAQYNLGNAYQKGRGVKQSDVMAVYWWERAAQQGMPNAAFNLGVQYLYGRGAPQDFQRALDKFRFAAVRNHVGARQLLASWDFEIPELAGSDPGDAARLAALLGAAPATVSLKEASEATSVSGAGGTSHPPAPDSHAVNTPETMQARNSAAQTAALKASPSDTAAPIAEKPQAVARAGDVPPVQERGSGDTGQNQAEVSSVLAVPGDRFTLQLAVMTNPGGIDVFLHRYGVEGDLYRYEFSRDSRMLHAVSIGSFGSREEARAFLDTLTQRMGHKPGWQTPWLRPFADIQGLVREAQRAE